jgi:hypothetical protein
LIRRLWALPVLVAGIGCASVLGIPNDTPSFCARPENQAHAYCEDFDVGDPSTRWTYAFSLGASSWAIKPSTDSPPNLIALSSQEIPVDGGSAVVGFDKEFTDAGFAAVHIEADMRLPTGQGGNFEGETGFLLVTDKEGGCVAMNFSPQGIGAFAIVTAEACSELTTTHAAGAIDAGPDGSLIAASILGPLPPRNSWFHVVIDVTPDGSGQGSGTLTLNVVGEPTGYRPLAIAKGTLTPTGDPLVGFSNAPQPGSGAIEVDYDNVTIDLRGSGSTP